MSRTVQSIVQSLSASTGSSRTLAVALHNFVRDEIQFGLLTVLTLQPPSIHCSSDAGTVLPRRTYWFICYAKLALRIPLLYMFWYLTRCMIIWKENSFPGRVQHCFTKVTVNGQLCCFDSYVIDKPLFQAAQSKFKSEENKSPLGYAIYQEMEALNGMSRVTPLPNTWYKLLRTNATTLPQQI